MKIVLDTNVFVSGIFWTGAPYKILDAWQKQKLTLIITSEILDEYIRVATLLQKKYQAIDIIPFIELVTIYAKIYQPIKLPTQISVDPDDDKFIGCALSSSTQLIVSGDTDLLNVNGYADLKILSPREFVDLYL